MRKSILSKISGYSSILNSASPDQNLQILRISLKKELDRKEKLQRLMQKYEQITVQQKTHIKSIKSNIIELKDLQANCKTKFYLNPIIYVDNNLTKDTRQYLCMLLNTFYSKYDQNSQCEFKTKLLSKEMNELLESISKNEENLLKIEKETIGVQVQLEGELLGYKTKLKDQTQRQKELEDELKRVALICTQYEDRYKCQLEKVEKLRANCQKIEEKIRVLKEKVAEGEMVKKGKEQMMANEIAYQEKFKVQLGSCDQDIAKENERQRALKVKIRQKKLQVEQLRGKFNKMCRVVDTVIGNPDGSEAMQLSSSMLGTNTSSYLFDSSKLSNSHLSLTQIKKYSCLVDSINTTLENTTSSFLKQQTKSKDCVNFEVGMKIVEMRNQNSMVGGGKSNIGSSMIRKERMSVR